MSILNVWFDRERGLVAVDSELVHAHGVGAAVPSTKVFPMPLIPAVIAGRGTAVFPLTLWNAMIGNGITDIEEMGEYFGQALPIAYQKMRREAAPAQLAAIVENTIALVGWSEKRQRIVGWEWTQTTEVEGFMGEELDGFYASPWQGEWGDDPDPSTPDAMLCLARHQAQKIRETYPNQAVAGKGGAMILAEITCDAVNLRKMGRLD